MTPEQENERIVLARLVAAERRIKNLEAYVTSLEQGAGTLRGIGEAEESPFVRRLRELDQQDAAEDPRR